MPPADRLQVLHADELAEPAPGQDRLHLIRVGRVSHHVADREDDTGLLDGVNDLDAPRPGRCDRFLEQHVVAELREAARRAYVLAVRSGDNHRIREPGLRGQVAPVVEPLVGRHPELVGQRVTAIGARIGDCDHTSPVRIPLRKAGERVTPGTGTEERQRNRTSRCHRTPYSPRRPHGAPATILAGLMHSYQNLLGFGRSLWCNRPEPTRAKNAITLPATTRAPFRQWRSRSMWFCSRSAWAASACSWSVAVNTPSWASGLFQGGSFGPMSSSTRR